MGGEIWVESRLGHGSTFHFTNNARHSSLISFCPLSPSRHIRDRDESKYISFAACHRRPGRPAAPSASACGSHCCLHRRRIPYPPTPRYKTAPRRRPRLWTQDRKTQPEPKTRRRRNNHGSHCRRSSDNPARKDLADSSGRRYRRCTRYPRGPPRPKPETKAARRVRAAVTPKSPPFHCPRPVVTTPCEEILRITLFPMSAM